jgi:sterol desaturase/sphingolipid hydroxylase (fatty acid hydroxylase superfamily)
MPAALALSYARTQTARLPLVHYGRPATYAFGLLCVGLNLHFGAGAALLQVLVAQIVCCYLPLGLLGEAHFHARVLRAEADGGVRRRRWRQSLQEARLATEALVGVCAFSCLCYEVVDEACCPYRGYYADPMRGRAGAHEYTAAAGAANVAFYLLFCDAWFYWWHYAFHALEALWPMHYQHHQLREPTSFGGPTVHVLELVLEYTVAHHLTNYLMPFHPVTHRALGLFAFAFGAIFNHGGLALDVNDHYAHHVTWKGGRAKYCNYGLFFPLWDVLNGTRYDPAAPPASAATPKEALRDEMVEAVVPAFGRAAKRD